MPLRSFSLTRSDPHINNHHHIPAHAGGDHIALLIVFIHRADE
jgi:hypothetical protein